MNTDTRFQSFQEFYPYYLSEHSNSTCRRLHYLGSTLVIAVVAYCVVTQALGPLLLIPVIGYGFAWIGHYFFERNRPATLTTRSTA